MVKLLFIANTISDLDILKSCVMDDVLIITYDPHKDKISKLEKKISESLYADNRITAVGWVFHSPTINDNTLINADTSNNDVYLFADVVLKIGKTRAVAKLIKFFKKLELIMDTPKPRIDLLGCCLLKNRGFTKLRRAMRKKMINSKLEIAASDDLTGSAYFGSKQDWVLESHNINLIGLYFTEEVNKYKYTFKGNPINNIQNNIADATFNAVEGNWRGALNGIGSALLMAPIRLPIVEGCEELYNVLKDPAVQTIFDSIPGLNLISFTVRMSEFVAKAAKGEASDWDIALCVLDSVSLVAGYAVPGANMSNAVIQNSVRAASNISKIKNLARSACNVLQFSKDIGEMVQVLVEAPNEKSIDDVAIQAAKIAVTAGIGKTKLSEQLKIAATTGTAANFYALKEVANRAEREYDVQQAALYSRPSVVIYSEINLQGSSIAIYTGTVRTDFGQFNGRVKSITVPARTAIRTWSGRNYNGEIKDWCNWNWGSQTFNIPECIILSALCVGINQDGSIIWAI